MHLKKLSVKCPPFGMDLLKANDDMNPSLNMTQSGNEMNQ